MTVVGWAQIALALALVLGCAIPLSKLIAGVYAGERGFLTPVIGPLQRGLYRLAGVNSAREQDWVAYTIAIPSPRAAPTTARRSPGSMATRSSLT
jgi:potassium-transporting ATPase potassium-binding subunit